MPAALLLSGSENSSKVEGGQFRWSGRTRQEREIGASMVVVVAPEETGRKGKERNSNLPHTPLIVKTESQTRLCSLFRRSRHGQNTCRRCYASPPASMAIHDIRKEERQIWIRRSHVPRFLISHLGLDFA
ncbi:hypothetical protein LXL04_007270 [Taraxacum kok-saghyz]